MGSIWFLKEYALTGAMDTAKNFTFSLVMEKTKNAPIIVSGLRRKN